MLVTRAVDLNVVCTCLHLSAFVRGSIARFKTDGTYPGAYSTILVTVAAGPVAVNVVVEAVAEADVWPGMEVKVVALEDI